MLPALSLFLPYLMGIGILPFLYFPDLVQASLGTPRRRARLLAALCAVGVLLNYALVLVIGRLTLSLAAGSIISVAGLAAAIWRFRGGLLSLLNIRLLAVPVAIIVGVYVVPIAFDPISAGDARSIWFFHGKMIYFSGGLGAWTGLRDGAVLFSHVDYPKLIGILSAEFAAAAGFWNEFVPKASLLALLAPAALAAVSFVTRWSFSSLFLLLIFFFSPGWLMWNGYMDGYLALYAGISLLFLGRWLNEDDPLDLLTGTVFLGLAGSLKNEGELFLFAVVITLFAIRGRGRAGGLSRIRQFLGYRFLIFALCAFSGFFLWLWEKGVLGLENDLHLGMASLPRITARLGDGSILLILKWLLIDALVLKAIAVLALSLAGCRVTGRRVSAGAVMAIATSFLYWSGICLVYLATPLDLQWHLATSAARTMYTVNFGLFAGIFLLLRAMESPSDSEPNDAALLTDQEAKFS